VPAALPSRAAADGLARPVGQGLGPRGLPEGCNSPKVHGSQPFLFRQTYSLFSLLPLSRPLLTSPDRVHELDYALSCATECAGCRAAVRQ